MYAIVIEQADDEPRVVVFDNEAEADRWRSEYEADTKGLWDSDPEWHNYPRDPIRVLSQVEAIDMLREDTRIAIEEYGSKETE